MAQDTLLTVVQRILSDADGDEVNSITDTTESTQCAELVRDVYDQIVATYDLQLHATLFRLTATDSTTPTRMIRPEGYYNIEWIKYDKRTSIGGDQKYTDITYLQPKDFLDMTSLRTLSDSTVEAMTLPDSGQVILIRNDEHPSYWTQLDGYDDIIFDSYDSAIDTTNLQNSMVIARGISQPTLALTDTATIDLPTHLKSMLRREARAMYFDLYKDGVTREVDRTRRREEVRAQRLRRIAKNADNDNSPDYGR